MSNVLLDSKGHSKLCDFSLCKILPPDGKTNSVSGTENYMAPEILKNQYYGYPVDFWSLGVCVYFMLTGTEPFKNSVEVLSNQIEDLNILREKGNEIDEITCEFVNKLLTENPYERLGSKTNNQNILNDPFFNSIDWNRLENGQIKPAITPNVVLFSFFCYLFFIYQD